MTAGWNRAISQPKKRMPAYIDISSLLNAHPAKTERLYFVNSFAADYPFGGGRFIYDPSIPRRNADGGVVFSPTEPNFLHKQNSCNCDSNGCYVRVGYDAVEPEMFGGRQGRQADDQSAAINAAKKRAQLDGLQLKLGPVKDWTIHRTIDLRGVHFEHAGTIYCRTKSVPVIVGGYYSTPTSGLNQRIGNVVSENNESSIPRVRAIGMLDQNLYIGNCEYFQVYADSDNNQDTASAYTNVFAPRVLKVELATNPSPIDESKSQWINSCSFFLRRTRDIVIKGTYPHNHNVFYDPTLERGSVDIEHGWDNRIVGVRGEGGLKVHFKDGIASKGKRLTTRNSIVRTWQTSNSFYDRESSIEIKGNTRENSVVSGTVPRSRSIFANLSARTFQSHKGRLSDVRVVDNSLEYLSYGEILRSIAVPVLDLDPVFGVFALGLQSGGIRAYVTGYDLNGNVLEGKAGDMSVSGVGSKRFSEVKQRI